MPKGAPGDGLDEHAEARATANDNAIVRIAHEIRHAVNGWRHGAMVDAFTAERAEVLAAWDELRARTHEEGEAVALSPTFRETLDRHAVLLKQAASFRARPEALASLLAERGGIGREELQEFKALHDHAHRYRRAALMRHVHRTKRELQRQGLEPEARQAELALEGGRARTRTTAAREDAAPPRPDWRVLYDALQRDWNALVARAEEPDLPLPLMDGYDALIPRLHALAAHPELPDETRAVLTGLLDFHEDQTVARQTAQGWLAAAERHVEDWGILQRRADGLRIPVSHMDEYPDWRDAARTLAGTGQAVLGDKDRYGAYLDAAASRKSRASLVLERLRERIVETRAEAVGRVEALIAAA